MVIGRKQGVVMLMFGLFVLTAGILVLITLPTWGNWIRDYPELVMQQQIPAQAAPTVQAMIGIVFGPMLDQVGSYIRVAGIFVGSLLTIIALFLSSVGMFLVTKRNGVRSEL